MPKWMLAPAFAILKRLSFAASFLLAGSLLLLPALACLWLLAPLSAPVLAAVVCLALLGAWFLAAVHSYMSFGVNRLTRVMERIASGELVKSRDSVGDNSSNDDSSRMWNSILKMNQSLGDIVRQVHSSADSIALATRDIAEGNNLLSQRTHEQAASLEQTASGMEELAATAQQNAHHCARATELAAGATGVAGQAAAQVRDVAATMKQIDDSARSVGQILATVEGIAFQTNILALNAAVEAARAGEQGRGFAVVAAEVRALAQRSAEAAKEINALIARSVSSAQQGRKLVEAAGETMDGVVTSVQEVASVIKDIALASAEQSSGIEAINEAVVQIDSATQENAALVEQASAAATAFEREAARLVEAVGRFKIDRGSDRSRVVALVKQGAKHLRQYGVEQACRDFNDRNGRFVQGEYYIFAVGLDGTRLAYAPDPSVIGQNGQDATDADGRFFGRELNQLARAHGVGWCDFKFLNPKSGVPEPKSVYIERVGDVVLGCGIYKSDEEQVALSARQTPQRGSRNPQPRARLPAARPDAPAAS